MRRGYYCQVCEIQKYFSDVSIIIELVLLLQLSVQESRIFVPCPSQGKETVITRMEVSAWVSQTHE